VFNNLAEVERYIHEIGIATVDLKYCDLFGGWHHLSLPAVHATERLLAEGVGFDSSSIPGFKAIEAGDMCLRPDPTAAFIDPFWDEPTLTLICNIVEADSGEPFHRDPRLIAKKAEDYLAASGFADQSKWGPEFEFYLFDRHTRMFEIQDRNNQSAFRLDAEDTQWSGEDSAGLGVMLPPGGGYHAIPPLDRHHDVRAEMAALLQEAGVAVHYHHHEVGTPSQQEIEVVLGSLLRMGDVSLMVKYFVKMTAQSKGLAATFMPKPMHREAGSGMHFHQHLFKNGEPLFHDKQGYGGLSDLALAYIAGVLFHSPALLALTNPTSNSYKRLIPGYEAPVNAFFSLANRSAAVRVPKYANAPMEKRIEFRPPDAACNPYIAMSAMLLAGVDGIKKQMKPGELGFGPFDQNLFAPEQEALRRKIRKLPASMDEAFKALSADHDFLVESGVFTEDTIETWIQYKMDQEYMEVYKRPHPYEHTLYFNC